MGLFKKDSMSQYNRYTLEEKATNKKAMTVDEYAALKRFRTRDVWDKVFQISGVVLLMFIIVLIVGTFLYPYSVFNVFGKGDRFYDCWQNIGVHLGKDHPLKADVYDWYGGFDKTWELYWSGLKDAKLAEFVNEWNNAPGQTIPITTDTKLWSSFVWDAWNNKVAGIQNAFKAECVTAYDWNGWITVGDIYKHGIGFAGKGAIVDFYAMGSWTIIPIATAGFVGIIVGAAYIVFYNVRNLIVLIKRANEKTVNLVTDLGAVTKESFVGAKEDSKFAKPKQVRRKAEKPVASVEHIEPKVEEPVVDTEKAAEEAELDAKIKSYKEELAKEEKVSDVRPVKDINNLSDDDLDKLLGNK